MRNKHTACNYKMVNIRNVCKWHVVEWAKALTSTGIHHEQPFNNLGWLTSCIQLGKSGGE
jgi:hypothetical protein